jgi:GNAT superfamily N-acetyltransferase
VENSTVRLVAVEWDDDRAVALRDLMEVEVEGRYRNGAEPPELAAERDAALSVDPSTVRATLLALGDDDEPIGHVALRRLGDEWEVKRLIVVASGRRRGAATALMAEAEARARAEGAPRLILQTGDKQPESIALYTRLGFTRIPVYEPYVATMPLSLCFEKVLAD